MENYPPFQPILLALNTSTNKRTKFLKPTLKPLTTNELTIKDSFHFAEGTVDQPDFFMGNFDVVPVLTNIPLEKAIEICTYELFKESFKGLSKSEFKEVFSLATKDSHFIFDGTVYKQIDGVAMDSPLGPTLANTFFVYHKKRWLEHCPLKYRPFYY